LNDLQWPLRQAKASKRFKRKNGFDHRLDFNSRIHRMFVVSNFPTMSLSVMADLVRVKDKFQLTIPVGIRRQFEVHEGDYLEASVSDDGIVFRPQSRVQATVTRSTSILDFLRESQSGRRTRGEIESSLSADRNAWDK
jgi:AbrB family looped-hinge helix DNA binding protein